MTTLREASQQALEALEWISAQKTGGMIQRKATEPIATLRAALGQRKPLTEEEISSLWDGHVVPVFGKNGINPIVFARAIERAHGIT